MQTHGTLVHIQFKAGIRKYVQHVDGILAPSIRCKYPTGEVKNGVYMELGPKDDPRLAMKLLDTGLQGCEDFIEPVGEKLYRLVDDEEIEKECGRSWSDMFPEKAEARAGKKDQ